MAIVAAPSCATCGEGIPRKRRYCSQRCYREARVKPTCRECGVALEGRRPYGNWCRDYRGEYYRRYNASKVEQQRARNLRKYQISVEDYEALLRQQDGRCAICRCEPAARRLAVDHDHETGRVRGLLCFDCNVALGKLKDDPRLLSAAIVYLGSATSCL